MTTIEQVIKKLGGVSKAQERFGYATPFGVYQWKYRGIPDKHIKMIHQKTKIPYSHLYKLTGEGLSRSL